MADNLPQTGDRPTHEILARLAAATPPEIIDHLSDMEVDDIKAALENAATILRRQTEGANTRRQEGGENSSLPESVLLDLNKILVVDDVKENIFLIEFMFKETEFLLSVASSAEEALAKARTELPILIISDIAMPGMSGYDLLKALKADELTKNIGIILVTAHHRSSKEISEGLQLGADDYINRPFVRDEFMSRVEAVLRMKRAEAKTQRQARILARRNEELAWLNELALAVNSSLDVQELFTSSMHRLSQLLDTRAVALVLLNTDKQQLMVSVASPTGGNLSVAVDLRDRRASLDTIIQEQAATAVLDIVNSHRVQLGLAAALELHPIHQVPMVSKEQPIGAIVIVDHHGEAIDETNKALLHSAAGIIAVAAENTRLLENAQGLVDDLIALNDIGRTLTSTLDLNQILKQTTLLAQQSLRADVTSLWLVDKAARVLELIAASGTGAELVTGYRLPIEVGIASYVVQTGEFYLSTDLSEDERYYSHVAEISAYEPRSMLSAPVQVKGEIIGVMQALHQNVNWFDENDLHLAGPIVNSVGIAVENARLFEQIQKFNRHLEQMVTERTQELAEEQERTEAILRSMADALLVFDAENRILTANSVAEKILDFHLSELVGQKVGPQELMSPLWRCVDELTRDVEPVAAALVDVKSTQPDSLLSVQAYSARVRNQAGQAIGTVITLRDITTLKEVERMKARFVSGVTHELKTPLSVIQLQSGNLMRYQERLPADRRNQLLHSIQTQAQHLEQLIEDILALSRLDSEIASASRRRIDLVELIDRVVTHLRPLAEAKRIDLVWRKPTGEVTIQVNRSQIEQLLRNLVDNAIKFTPSDGKVEVQTLVEPTVDGGENARIRVSDTGPGIPPKYQDQVFERFYRIDSAHTTPGTGLGLAIVKEVVDAHGGSLHLQSQPEQGSLFIVTLPLANQKGE